MELNLLPIPDNNWVPDSIEGLQRLFPPRESLNSHQKLQYDFMCEQFEGSRVQGEKYDWDGVHGGSIWPFVFRNGTLLKEQNESQGNYCVGVTAEQYYHWHRKHMQARNTYEGELDLTWDEMWHGFRAFMVGSADPGFEKGVAGGAAFLYSTLKKHYEAALDAGFDIPDNFHRWLGYKVEEVSDWKQLQFGDLISMNHSCIFVGYEEYKGDIWIRVFQSINRINYKYGERGNFSGLGAGSWKKGDFTARFDLASRIVPIEPYYSNPVLTSSEDSDEQLDECVACPNCGHEFLP